MSCFTCWVHVISTQVKDIINGKSNEHDNSEWLGSSELLAIPYHHSHDGDNDDCNIEDRNDRSDWVSCNKHKHDEWETHSNSDTLESSWKKSFFYWDSSPSNICLHSSLQILTVVITFLIGQISIQFLNPNLPFLKNWFLNGCRIVYTNCCFGRDFHVFNFAISIHDLRLEWNSDPWRFQPFSDHLVECFLIINWESNWGIR